MRILVGEFIDGFNVKGDLGFGGNEMILLQVQLKNLNTLQRSEGPSIIAKAVYDGFWLGTNRDDKNPEQTLEQLKKTLAKERIRFFRVFKVRNTSKQTPEGGGKVWTSNSKSSYAGNFVQLGLIYKDEKSSTYYIFRRTKGHIDFWARTEDLSLVRQYLKALGQSELLTKAISEKKKLIKENKKVQGTPTQQLSKQVGNVLQILVKATPAKPAVKPTEDTKKAAVVAAKK